jgi:hypothetical protein
MPDFKRWDVIKIPHPYGEAPARHHRPALVLAAGDLQIAHGLLWIMMITTAPNFRWPARRVSHPHGKAHHHRRPKLRPYWQPSGA